MAAPAAALAPLTNAFRTALRRGDAALDALVESANPAATDRRDQLLALLTIHDLGLAPIDAVGSAVRFQHHPAVAALRWQLEAAFVNWLSGLDATAGWSLPVDAVAAIRAIAVRD